MRTVRDNGMKSLETAFDTLGILEDDYLMIRFLQRAERINKEDPLEFEILDGNNRVVLMLHRKKTTYRKYIDFPPPPPPLSLPSFLPSPS
jgi:hypothetical protein